MVEHRVVKSRLRPYARLDQVEIGDDGVRQSPVRQRDGVRTQIAMDETGAMGRAQGQRDPLRKIDDVLLGRLARAKRDDSRVPTTSVTI